MELAANFNLSYISLLFVTIAPITISECPPIYLVTECKTISEPNNIGDYK